MNFIHRTYLGPTCAGDEGYVVGPARSRPGELASRTLVGMDAVFFKLGTYEGQKGPVQAPLFLGKSLRIGPKERMADGPVANLSGGAILGVAVGRRCSLMLVLTSRMFRKAKPPAPKGPAILDGNLEILGLFESLERERV